MKKKIEHYSQKTQINIKPGITVGLVSIPLSISLALASGVSPVIGVLSAFWGGVVAALFAGSAYNIIGPTGALSGLILTFVLAQGIAMAPALTIFAGILILIAWAFNFHKYLIYIPGAVIHGFTLGVAFIIGLGQLNNAFALSPHHTHESLILNIMESLKVLPDARLESVVLFVTGLLFLITVKKKAPTVPGAIALSLIGIGIGYASTSGLLPFTVPTLFSKYGALTLQLFPTALPKFSITPALFQGASVIAIIAIIETMLSAKVANLMTKTRFHERREMLALALANITSGLMGGIPVTAALARTSLNIKTGANSRMSALFSAITIGIISVAFFGMFQYLPLPIIAAILVNVAINMVEQEHFAFLFKHDKPSFIISLIVGVVTIAADPIIAVSLGSIILLLRQVQRLSIGDYEILVNHNKKLTNRLTDENLHELEKGGDPFVYSFNTDLTYLNRDAHLLRIHQLAPKAHNVILRFRTVSYIDPDGILMLEEIIELFERHSASVYFVGLSEEVRLELEKTPYFDRYTKHNSIFEKTTDALAYIYRKKK
jgi:SulP family sulfate permease